MEEELLMVRTRSSKERRSLDLLNSVANNVDDIADHSLPTCILQVASWAMHSRCAF